MPTMMNKFTTLILCLIPSCGLAQERSESYMGSLAPVMRSIQKENDFRMDYFHCKGLPPGGWRRNGRAEVHRTLSYSPASVPLDVKVQSTIRREGYEVKTISFAGSPHYRLTISIARDRVASRQFSASRLRLFFAISAVCTNTRRATPVTARLQYAGAFHITNRFQFA